MTAEAEPPGGDRGSRSRPAPSSRATPAAIVVAGALIGLGAYLGLGRRDDVRPARVEWKVTTAAPSAPDARPPPSAPLAAPVEDATAELRARVRAEAARGFEARREALRSACWDPSMARSPSPPSVRLRVRAVFDAAGQQVAFGVDDPEDTRRSDVAACVTREVSGLTVTPPGRRIGVELAVDLP